MTDIRRKGSLAWYQNSRRGLSSLVPKHPKCQGIYGVKMGMTSEVVDDVLTPITLVHLMDLKKTTTKPLRNEYSVDFTGTKTLRKKVLRCLSSEKSPEELRTEVLNSEFLDVVALTKGRGTLGPVQRRHIKLQKRKAAGSGVTRKPGSMGLRVPGKVVWTKPMSGKTGFSRRTIYNLKNCGTRTLKDFVSLRYFVKNGVAVAIKGAIPGTIGRPVFLRRALRKCQA